MTEAPIISGQWRDVYERMLTHFTTLSVPGERGLSFLREVSLADMYFVTISQSADTLLMKMTCWKKQNDYGRWRREIAFSPSLITEELVLTGEDTVAFSAFFDALSVEEEKNLLVERGVLILDGEQFRMQLFRDNKSFRSFSWNSATDAVGLMENIIKMTNGKR